MMKRIPIAAVMILALLACGASDKEGPQKRSGDHAADSTAPSGANGAVVKSDTAATGATGGARRYAVKSAEMTMTSTSPVGEPMTLTIVFDDYGARESTRQDMVATVQGKRIEISNVTVIRDGWAVIYDPKSRIGTRSPATTGFLSNIPDFASLDSLARTALRYKTLDVKNILGKECQGHEFVKDGLPIRVWMWEGIPLRSEIEIQTGSPIVSVATALNTDVVPADSLFVVPSDVKVTTVGGGSK